MKSIILLGAAHQAVASPAQEVTARRSNLVPRSSLYWKAIRAELLKYEQLIANGDYFAACDIKDRFRYSYAWAIPSEQAVSEICKFASGSSILEINSGKGLWAELIRGAGLSIVATDLFYDEWGSLPNNPYHRVALASNLDEFNGRLHGNVFKAEAVQSVKNNREHDVLMSVWPCMDMDYATKALREFRGSRFVLVGDRKNQVCGDDSLYETLLREWKLEKEVTIPNFVRGTKESYDAAIRNGLKPMWANHTDSLLLYRRASV